MRAALAIIGGPVAAAWFVWCDWVPQSTLDRLPRSSRAEVRDLLGEPSEVEPAEPEAGAGRWYYRRPYRVAEFRVNFDDGGQVEGWSYDR